MSIWILKKRVRIFWSPICFHGVGVDYDDDHDDDTRHDKERQGKTRHDKTTYSHIKLNDQGHQKSRTSYNQTNHQWLFVKDKDYTASKYYNKTMVMTWLGDLCKSNWIYWNDIMYSNKDPSGFIKQHTCNFT